MKHLCKIALLVAIFLTGGCKKYEDGPAVSLMTAKARLANVWQVDTYYINGADKTSDYRQNISRERLVIYQSGKFDYSEVSSWVWAPMSYTGTWRFLNDKEDVELKPDDPSMQVQTYHILKLKKNELWLERELFSGFVTEFHYTPVKQ